MMATNCVIIYMAMFGMAYGVTEAGEGLNSAMLGLASRVVFRPPLARPKECLVRVISKSPPLALSLGGFHRVQRETIPVLVDFGVKQVLGPLVSFGDKIEWEKVEKGNDGWDLNPGRGQESFFGLGKSCPLNFLCFPYPYPKCSLSVSCESAYGIYLFIQVLPTHFSQKK
jgi:hypothetical protein